MATIVTEDQVVHVRRDRLHKLECAAGDLFKGAMTKPIRDDSQGYASSNFLLKNTARITLRTNGEIVVDSNLGGIEQARNLAEYLQDRGFGDHYVVIRGD